MVDTRPMAREKARKHAEEMKARRDALQAGHVSDIHHQYSSWPMRFKFPVQQVFCYIACPKRFRHSPVWISFPDWTEEIESMHETADLLGIHDDSSLDQSHMNAEDAFFVTPEVVSFKDQLEILLILGFFFRPISF